MNSVVRRHRETVIVTLPLRLRNPLNGAQSGWRAKAAIRKRDRTLIALAVRPQVIGLALPVRVIVTRIAPRAMDLHDGVPAACKGVVDGVADALGISDNDPRVSWAYDQRRGGPGEYGVEIVLQPA